MTPQTNPHRNAEKVVKCPVDGCEAEKLSRGMHLHVLRSAGNGHGPQGDVPEHLDCENLEEVGTQEVEVNYPEERKTESVARLCPYCETPFKGKNGVLIHLGQVEGRKNHPTNASEVHEPGDFPVVELDEGENVVAVVEGRIPSSMGNWPYEEGIPVERVYRLIAELLAEGHSDTAARVRSLLLADE